MHLVIAEIFERLSHIPEVEQRVYDFLTELDRNFDVQTRLIDRLFTRLRELSKKENEEFSLYHETVTRGATPGDIKLDRFLRSRFVEICISIWNLAFKRSVFEHVTNWEAKAEEEGDRITLITCILICVTIPTSVALGAFLMWCIT